MDQLFGQKVTFDPTGYGAATGSSPSIIGYLNIGVAPTSNAAVNVGVEVKLHFKVKFFEPRSLI